MSHVAFRKMSSIHALETTAENPVTAAGSKMAACLMMTLEHGGIASITANYLNPPGTGIHGYESLIIHGTQGLMESLRGGSITRLVIGNMDCGQIPNANESLDYFDLLANHISNACPMPLSVDDETSPTRWMIRAKNQMTKFR